RVLELRSVRGTGGGPEKTILRGAARSDPQRFAVTVCYVRDLRDPEFALDGLARELGVDYSEVMARHSFDRRIWPVLRDLIRTLDTGAARSAAQLPAAAVVIGSVGRLEPQKRFDLLLEAFASLRASRPDLHLVLVGDGSLGDALRNQARSLGVLDACTFTGHR